jgi:hypothetical protein
MNNIGLLIKLKENLTNKQNEFESEIKNISNEVNEDNSNDKENNLELEKKDCFDIEIKTNPKINIIVEDDKQTLKIRKRPNMFRRNF